ncbi:MAG: hypothetical protein A2136_09205 [Chloroflexi bacterium RBG_16_54_11]|nr:MAG: hypothetical protein A2136_09205 [Chloroflexi bacterium RBG_16_54_11]
MIVGVLLGAGIIFLVTRPPRGKAIILLPPPTQAPLTIYLSGGVKETGLYSLPPGSRVNDAIQAAGGLADGAIISQLNLAKLLVDGERVDVPVLATLPSPAEGTQPVNGSVSLVDINSATLEQLDTLPEIGPKTAQNILDYRRANGPFARIEDIQDVPGIGQITFDKIKDLITVGVGIP